MENLSQVLWRERELLGLLLYKLEVEQMVLASARTQWLMRAAQEVEGVLEMLRETEVLRAVAADEAAANCGLATHPSLRALAEAIDEPWRSILLDHRDAFVRMTAEVEALADTNRDLITSGYRAAREALLTLGDATDSYSPDGTAVVSAPARRLVDRAL